MDTNAQFLLIQATHRMTLKYDPHISHRYVENIRARIPNENGGYFVRTNSLGFRSDRNYHNKKGNLPRILMFGDSNTAGDGVSNHQRFSDIVARELHIEVFNYGLPGTGTDQQLLSYQTYANGVEADLAILFITAHNIERIKAKYWETYERTTGEYVLAPKPYFSLSASNELILHHVPVPTTREPAGNQAQTDYIAPFTKGDQYLDPLQKLSTLKKIVAPVTRKLNLGIQEKLKRRIKFQPHVDYDNPNSEGWKLMTAIIKQFYSEILPLPLIVVPLPTLNHLYEKCAPNYIDPFDSLSSSEKNIQIFNLTSELLKLSRETRYKMFFKHDSHFAPFGHQIIAKQVANYLVKNRLIQDI